MIIIGVDFHPAFQQIASVDTETGEFQKSAGHGPTLSETRFCNESQCGDSPQLWYSRWC